MATGSVGVSGRARKMVALNSPRLMVKANNAATKIGRRIRGQSTSHQVRQPSAPSMAAASLSDCWILLKPGRTLRKTKGTATTAWTMGNMRMEDRRLSGGRPKAMRYPRPSVTADVASGSMKRASSSRVDRLMPRRTPFRAARSHSKRVRAAMRPKPTARSIAPVAMVTELRIASTGGTKNNESSRLINNA